MTIRGAVVLVGGVAVWSVIVAGCAAEPGSPIGPSGEWQELIAQRWSLDPGGENTSQWQVTNLERDLVIGGMRPLAPIGTHHTLLYRGLDTMNMVYASGVGTGELRFPEGTGFKLSAGTVLALQLHIFNQTEARLTGTSGIEFLEIDPNSVEHEVDLFLPGPKDLAIAPRAVSKAEGTCTVTQPYTIFALFPHMHQLGTHFKAKLDLATGQRVLHDAPFEFEHQAVESFEPISLEVGDTITTECTWRNDTDDVVGYGESSATEMCFSIMYRYPRRDGEYCTQ